MASTTDNARYSTPSASEKLLDVPVVRLRRFSSHLKHSNAHLNKKTFYTNLIDKNRNLYYD